jgi:hypothetical protein
MLQSRFAPVLFFFLFSSITAVFAAIPHESPGLTDGERAQLRFRLERLFEEVDLTVRNHRANQTDVERQEQTLQILKIYDRIPLQPRVEELPFQLRRSARKKDLTLLDFKLLPQAERSRPIPPELFTDERSFRLRPDQITESIPFHMVVRGEKSAIFSWIRSWPVNVTRVIEAMPLGIRQMEGRRWEIDARAFRYRDVGFPHLKLRDPTSLLPQWARSQPQAFAHQEPILWSLVERTMKAAPRATALLSVKERFLLNDARINFFFLKAGAAH